MRNTFERGSISALLIPLIVACMLLAGAIAFGAWAFSSRQDYKLHSDQKSAKAAQAAVDATQNTDAIKYAEAAKNPLKTYKGPSAFGSVTVLYPKTWSAYIIESTNSSTPVNGYFHPDIVPDTSGDTNAFSLRIQVVPTAYDQVVSNYAAYISSKKATAQPFAFPKVSNIIGTRIDGQISTSKQGTLIVVPLRNLTLIVSAESKDYLPDFQNIIIPNLSFSP